jgi:hypothetical protein
VIDVPVVRSDSLDSRSFFLELQVAKPSKKTEPQLLTHTRNSNQSPTPAGSIKKENLALAAGELAQQVISQLRLGR